MLRGSRKVSIGQNLSKRARLFSRGRLISDEASLPVYPWSLAASCRCYKVGKDIKNEKTEAYPRMYSGGQQWWREWAEMAGRIYDEVTHHLT